MTDRDWYTDDDYAPEDANWLAHNTLGGDYDEEMDLNREGHWRHRLRKFGSPWKKGPAPREPQDVVSPEGNDKDPLCGGMYV